MRRHTSGAVARLRRVLSAVNATVGEAGTLWRVRADGSGVLQRRGVVRLLQAMLERNTPELAQGGRANRQQRSEGSSSDISS